MPANEAMSGIKTKRHRIFLSHVQRDESFCDLIDKVVARESLGRFPSELESVKPQERQTRNRVMDSSIALFLIMSREFIVNKYLLQILLGISEIELLTKLAYTIPTVMLSQTEQRSFT